MNETPKTPKRKPAVFNVEGEPSTTAARRDPVRRSPASFDENILMTPDADDPFFATTTALPAPPEATPRKRHFSFGKLAFGALGISGIACRRPVDRQPCARSLHPCRLARLPRSGCRCYRRARFSRGHRPRAGRRHAAECRTGPEAGGNRCEPCADAQAGPEGDGSPRASACRQAANGARALAASKETETEIIDGPHLLDLDRARTADAARSRSPGAHPQRLEASLHRHCRQPSRPRRSRSMYLRIRPPDPGNGRPLRRTARHVRIAAAYARRHRPSRCHRFDRCRGQPDPAGARPWSSLETVRSARRRRHQRPDDGAHRHRRDGSLPSDAVSGL